MEPTQAQIKWVFDHRQQSYSRYDPWKSYSGYDIIDTTAFPFEKLVDPATCMISIFEEGVDDIGEVIVSDMMMANLYFTSVLQNMGINPKTVLSQYRMPSICSTKFVVRIPDGCY